MHWGKMEEGHFYLGGGSGYNISSKALKAFVEGPLQLCSVTQEGSAGDVYFTNCARNLTSEFIYTGDEYGGLRYIQGPVYLPLKYGIFRQAEQHMEQPPLSITPKHLDNHKFISNSNITFHKHYNPVELRRLEMLLYKDLYFECAGYH